MIQSYRDLSISQFDALSDILNSEDDARAKDLKILSLLSGLSIPEINNLPVGEGLDMMKKATFLESQPVFSPVTEFQYNGFVFKVNSSLTYAQYVDFENSKSTVQILRAILVPEGHSYNDGYDLDFSNLNCITALSVLKAFINGLMVSSVASVKSFTSKLLFKNPLLFFNKGYRQLISLLRSTLYSLSSRRSQK